MSATLVVELDQAELACRILEAFQEIKRPDGASPSQALSVLRPDDKRVVMNAALAALKYLEECTNKSGRVQ